MTTYTVDVTVEELLDVLQHACDRRATETFEELPKHLVLEVEASISSNLFHDQAIELGYVHEDDALGGLEPEARDLSDAVRALIEGDKGLAATLFARALDGWPSAALAVETALLNRTAQDRRQCALALAA